MRTYLPIKGGGDSNRPILMSHNRKPKIIMIIFLVNLRSVVIVTNIEID